MQAFFVFFRHLPGSLRIRFLIVGRHLLRNCHNACRLIVPIHDRRPGLIHLNRPVSPVVIVAPKRLLQAKIRESPPSSAGSRELARLRCAIGEME